MQTETIKLNNDIELECLHINWKERNVRGFDREVFEIYFPVEGNTFDELNTIFSNPENTSKITLTEGDEEFVYNDFSLHLSTEMRNVEVQRETPTTPAVYEGRYVVTLAQLTYLEKLVQQLLSGA